MKRLIFAVVGVWFSVFAGAQTADALPSAQERAQEAKRLSARRQALEAENKKNIRQCYQAFDVTDCLTQIREKRIAAQAELRKDELQLNAQERQAKIQEAQARLADKNSPAQQQEAQAKREQAQQDNQARAEDNAQKNVQHTAQGNGRAAYEQKQKEAQAHREDLQKRLKESGKKPAAGLPPPTDAK